MFYQASPLLSISLALSLAFSSQLPMPYFFVQLFMLCVSVQLSHYFSISVSAGCCYVYTSQYISSSSSLSSCHAASTDSNIYIYIYHHHVVLVAWISLTLSRHFSLSFITSGRSSGLHPVSSHSCWMYIRAGRPAFAQPYVGVHKNTSLMSSSLLLQQCPACLVHLTWIVFLIGGRWPYSWCLVGCCRQDLFKIARSILV